MWACLPITKSSIACPSAYGQYSGCVGASGKRLARRVVVVVKRDLKTHWEKVYSAKPASGVSWYQSEPRLSLELIRAVAPTSGGRIIDVGGGASVLVDRLLDQPFVRIAVLDIAETALGKVRSRLGERGGRIEWIAADVTEIQDVGTFDVWHDRAVFHFLTDAADRRKYVDLARRTVPAGGHLIIASFAEDGPKQCSNLGVCRYNAESIVAELGAGFSLFQWARETHITPCNTSQAFLYAVFRRQ
jgi:2-polyprenyl-3-methyl-5-hydroxy-6-metoxy-1,4-benzoquinol methylase